MNIRERLAKLIPSAAASVAAPVAPGHKSAPTGSAPVRSQAQAGLIDTISPAREIPASVAALPGAAAFARPFIIYSAQKPLFGSRSPSFTWVALNWIRHQQSNLNGPLQGQPPARFSGLTDDDVVKAMRAVEADRALALRAPHDLLDQLGVPGRWDGGDLSFRVVAGTEDQWKFEVASWVEALIIGQECSETLTPVEIVASYRGNSVRFFKYGQTLVERIVARRKIEDAKRDQNARAVEVLEASQREAKSKAAVDALAAQANQRSGLVVGLLR